MNSASDLVFHAGGPPRSSLTRGSTWGATTRLDRLRRQRGQLRVGRGRLHDVQRRQLRGVPDAALDPCGRMVRQERRPRPVAEVLARNTRIVGWRNSRGGTRTPDPVINSHLLYQLSYSGRRTSNGGCNFAMGPAGVKSEAPENVQGLIVRPSRCKALLAANVSDCSLVTPQAGRPRFATQSRLGICA